MKVSDISLQALQKSLKNEGIFLRTGSFINHIQSPIPSLAEGICLMYGDYAIEPESEFADFHVSLCPPFAFRNLLQKQVIFYFDGYPPFKPLPIEQAFPMLEWGLNWCVTGHSNQYLIAHAAVVEKFGHALIMPGTPGSGKSTLCAALVSKGWRLLSDELTLISPTSGTITPLPRPISLKNESIEVIRRFNQQATIGKIAYDTAKGSVAQMRVPTEHVRREKEGVQAAWIVFPKYIKDAETTLSALSKGHCTIRLIDNLFNYSALGKRGFTTTTNLVDQCECFDFSYSNLDDAIECFDYLAKSKRKKRGALNGQA